MFGEFARIAVRGTGTYGLWRSLIAIVRIPDSSLTLCQVRKVPNSELDGFTQHRVGAAMLVAQQCRASEPFAKHRYCRLGLLGAAATDARVKVGSFALDRGSGGGPLGADRSVTSHDNFLRGQGNAGSHI